MATTKKSTTKATAKKAVAPKRDANLCHWGAGSYGSPSTSNKCTRPLVVGKQLCAECEAKWKVVSKQRAATKKAAAPAPKLSVVKQPTAARTPAPRHEGVVARVPESQAAFLAVEPTVTKVE